MRVLLIQPPFWAVNSPSIGLGYLKAALGEAGMDAGILYGNLEFASRLGRRDYDAIQSGLPVELLFGDAVFAGSLLGSEADLPGVQRAMREILSRPPATRAIPETLLDRFPDFSRMAAEFVEAFKSAAPWKGWDLVGFTTTFTLVPALAMAKAMKADPDAPPVVFGGSHCDGTLGRALMETFPWVDFVGRGEGEEQIVSLARAIGKGDGAFEAVDGLLWRENGRVREAPVGMARAADLDALPYPSYNDWVAGLDARGWKEPEALRLPIETSRGCWYGDRNRCVFCGLNGMNDRFRSKSADRILREYESLLSYGIPFFNAVDNVLDPHHFKGALPRIAALESKATLFFEIRPTQTKGQLVSLKEAGVRFLQPGIESLDTRLLSLMNKGTNTFQNLRLLRWTAELGMPVFWNLLYGLPGEEAADYEAMADLVPALVHLFPPLATCNRIHVDRFSPLFNRHQDSIRPNPLYGLSMGLDPGRARDLAYHFEFDSAHPFDPETVRAIERLNEAVLAWHAAVGQAAFVSLDRDGKRWLFDSRPGAQVEEAELDGVEAQILRMADAGISLKELRAFFQHRSEEIDGCVQEFLSRGWLTFVDGKLLNLAVPMDEHVPDGIPPSTYADVSVALYCNRIELMWKTCKG